MKSVEQQTAMALHRVRDHLVRQRTGTMNALRGHLAEHGLVAPLLRARTVDEFWSAVAEYVQSFKPVECSNYFQAACYEPD